MALLQLLASALAWLGRQGTRAVALTVFIGMALPPLADLLKPYIPEAIFLLLVCAFLRVEPAALRGYARKPGLVIAATFWGMIVLPASFGAAMVAFGADTAAPQLMLALVLQVVAPPLTASPAFVALLGLDTALSLSVLVLSIIVTPLTAPAFVGIVLGGSLQFSPLELALKLFLLLAGAGLTAAAIRFLAGRERVARHRDHIDGANVLLLFLFAIALMGDVGRQTLAAPLRVLGLTALAFLLSFAIVAVTTLVFARAGRARAFALGLTTCHRNMGLMLAATGGAVPELTWLYFALAQFPIYLMPQLLKPFAQRLVSTGEIRRGGHLS